MRKFISIVLTSIFLLFLNSCIIKPDLSQYGAKESYPEDSLLWSVQPNRAMIVIAHDDDMCAMSGTISKLHKLGWELAVISFSNSPERNQAHIKACSNLLDTVLFVELKPEQYRNDLDENSNPYYAIPKESFAEVFNRDLVEQEFLKQIKSFNPGVIFTLDNEIGGYGHPEHVFISQLVIDWVQEQQVAPRYIYQSVFSPDMEQSIMDRHSERMKSWGFPGDEWENAKRIYGVDGMPEPTVEINIRSEAKEKMNYLLSYNEREREILGFFFPFFEKFEAEEYFEVFDREFFRVIKIEYQEPYN